MIQNDVIIKNLLQHLVDISPYRLYDNEKTRNWGISFGCAIWGNTHSKCESFCH